MKKQEIIDENHYFLEKYGSFKETWKRYLYQFWYSYNVIFTRCSGDGLGEIENIFGLTYGYSTQIINVGGTFKAGWPLFDRSLADAISNNRGLIREVVVIITYHWSLHKESNSIDCGCNKDSVDACIRLAKKLQKIYELKDTVTFAVIGICTDDTSLRLHSLDEYDVVDTTTIENLPSREQKKILRKLFASEARSEFIHFVRRVIRKNALYRKSQKAEDIAPLDNPKECIAIGENIDWLNSGKIFLIGAIYENGILKKIIEKATTVIQQSVEKNQSPDKKEIVIFISVSYSPGNSMFLGFCEEEAKKLANAVLKYAHAAQPQLFNSPHCEISVLVGVTNQITKVFSIVEYNAEKAIQKAEEKYREKMSHLLPVPKKAK